jgi:hypothetical protein
MARANTDLDIDGFGDLVKFIIDLLGGSVMEWGPPVPAEEQVGREYFARAPDSDIWVSVRDLPDATRDAIWKRFENTKGAFLRIGIDENGQLKLSGFPPDYN